MKNLFNKNVKKIFITGGSGFIGSHICDLLLQYNYKVTVFDNFSNGKKEFITTHLNNNNFNLIEGDCLDLKLLLSSIENHDLIWHLAANTDLISSHSQPDRDLKDCVLATFNVLEAMKIKNIRDILFASSGAVYGKLCLNEYVNENSGPLKPMSPYGAGKVSSEAFIHSYSHLYKIRSLIFRFGNVIGSRVTHGILFDFINKLKKKPNTLTVLGDGTQEKNYFLTEECIDGMIWSYNNINLSEENPCEVINLGTDSVSNVITIAKIVIDEMDLNDITKIQIEGKKYAWLGDQPKVHLDTKKINNLGWKTKHSSDEAVRKAVRRILKNEI
jgi:UDP-glucose 4-epimerase